MFQRGSATVRVLSPVGRAGLISKAAIRTAIVLAACASFAFLSASPLTAANNKADTKASSKTSHKVETAGSKETTTPSFDETIAEWNGALDRIEASLNEPSVSDSALDAARITLEEQSAKITRFLDEWRPREKAARAQSEKLGPAPDAAHPPEGDAIIQQRAEVSKTFSKLSSTVKAAAAALTRTKDLDARVSEMRRVQFGRRILRRTDSPLSLAMWRNIATHAPDGLKQFGMVFTDWWTRITDKAQFLSLLIATLLCGGGLIYLSRLGVYYFRHWQESELPTEWRRGTSAGWVILLRMLPVTIAASGFYYALETLELLPPPAMEVMASATIAIIILTVVRAVARTVLAIERPHWRLLPLSNIGAVTLYYYLLALATVYAADLFITSFNHAASIPFSLNDAQNAIASITIAGIIISILRIRASNGDESSEVRRIGPHYVRIPLWLIALTILATAAAGYIPLARFITSQLIITSTVIIIVYLLSFWASSFGRSIADDETVVGQWLHEHVGLTQERRERLVLPITLLLKALVLLSAVPFIMFLWGFDTYDIRRWVELVLFGFDFGTTKISLTAILGALAVFAAAYVAAGIFRVWLDRNVLEPAGVEDGVRDSVRAGVGYLGFGLAAIAAISYAGFDFSSLAIVAGALSLGLGFGMQSIVNNFVSGLILLAERPIKVGDWIVVTEGEGIVKNISVRATIIETFDRSNIIIPNSQLISQTVQNWTLKNNTGRIKIPVGVHYDSDPDAVIKTLLNAARNNSRILTEPEPFVYFNDFADSSLNFTLYAYTVNVRQRLSVSTELRLAILKSFREQGIEIPYPQTDVHMRDISWIKQAIISRVTQNTVESHKVTPDNEEHYSSPVESVGEFQHNAPRDSDPDSDGDGSGS